jgi:hypothetical protein
MKKTTNSLTRTQTASWQYDSMDLAEGMDNKDHPSYKKLAKYSGNPSKSPAGSPDSINKGRGPVTGNDGRCHHSGMPQGGATPPVSAVPAVPKQGSVRDNINRGAQVRTPGGTREMPKRGKESFDFGRGPTKGNQQ